MGRQVLRVWKRDGSRNVMSMKAALANMRYNGNHQAAHTILYALRNKGVIETNHARFALLDN
jgi:hypothetical protein